MIYIFVRWIAYWILYTVYPKIFREDSEGASRQCDPLMNVHEISRDVLETACGTFEKIPRYEVLRRISKRFVLCRPLLYVPRTPKGIRKRAVRMFSRETSGSFPSMS